MQLPQDRRDAIIFPSAGDHTCGMILDQLQLFQKCVRHALKKGIAHIKSRNYGGVVVLFCSKIARVLEQRTWQSVVALVKGVHTGSDYFFLFKNFFYC